MQLTQFALLRPLEMVNKDLCISLHSLYISCLTARALVWHVVVNRLTVR